MIKKHAMYYSIRGRGQSNDFSKIRELLVTYDENNELHIVVCMTPVHIIHLLIYNQQRKIAILCRICYLNDKSTKVINNDANVRFRKTIRNPYTMCP